jgi:hypothetical protein
MGDEVGHDLLDEVSCDLLVDKTTDSQCLKDEMTFALQPKYDHTRLPWLMR